MDAQHDQRSDTRRYVISLAGSNRIGALAAVSQAVAELGGNIGEIRQTVVDKFFAILLSADFPGEREVELITAHIRDFCREFDVQIHVFDPHMERHACSADPASHPYRLVGRGPDEAGTLRRISACLAQNGIDVADVFACRADEIPTFEIRLRLIVPKSMSRDSLEAGLSQLGTGFSWVLEEV